MNPKYKFYLNSISAELNSKSNQVRDLIGDRHWLSDGKHKEKILIDVIRRFLPSGYVVGSGFVVSRTSPGHISREQDVLIFDTRTEPILFKCDDLIISTGEALVAAIAVKTKFEKKEIKDSVKTLLTAREVCSSSCRGNKIWCGMFSFERPKDFQKALGAIAQGIVENPFIAPTKERGEKKCGPDVFCEGMENIVLADYGEFVQPNKSIFGRLRGFERPGESAATFIALLLEAISQQNDNKPPGIASLLRSESEEIDPLTVTISQKDVLVEQMHRRKRKR